MTPWTGETGSPKGDQAREQILTTAARLFATHGFDGTGVRRIAKEAGVNIAMVNYYFGGKTGILREIFTQFFDTFRTRMAEEFEKEGLMVEPDNHETGSLESPPSFEEENHAEVEQYFARRLTVAARVMVRTIRSLPENFDVVTREITVPRPELDEEKARSVRSLIPIVYGPFAKRLLEQLNSGNIPRIGPRNVRMDIVGPVFASGIFSHFLLQWLFPFLTGATYDDAFFKEYEETIPQILLYGVFGRSRTADSDSPSTGGDR